MFERHASIVRVTMRINEKQRKVTEIIDGEYFTLPSYYPGSGGGSCRIRANGQGFATDTSMTAGLPVDTAR